jgi:hypothetical protein
MARYIEVSGFVIVAPAGAAVAEWASCMTLDILL